MTSKRGPAVALICLALLVAACGSDGDEAATTTAGDTASTTITDSTSTSDGSTTSTAEETTSTTAVTTSTTGSTSSTTAGLPGKPIEFGPRAGDALAVIGVAHDDVLNVREVPGVEGAIVDRLDPLADNLTAQGRTRDLGRSFWIEIDTGTVAGWVNLRFVGYLGVVTDETATVVTDLGELPAAETMVDLGRLVADTFASVDPDSRIVQVTAPSVGDLGEITYDVIGLGDDAQVGWRVHVFGAEDEGGEFFGLMSAEVTALCGRGVTADGLCV